MTEKIRVANLDFENTAIDRLSLSSGNSRVIVYVIGDKYRLYHKSIIKRYACAKVKDSSNKMNFPLKVKIVIVGLCLVYPSEYLLLFIALHDRSKQIPLIIY